MILLVDDQADVRFMLSLFLEDEGIEFDEATSGEEALERHRERNYDLILLDQRMPPGMSGIEVAERLRDEGSETPIVLYSAFLDPQVEARALELGLRIVDKGEPDRLVEAIKQTLAAGLVGPAELAVVPRDAARLDELHADALGRLGDDHLGADLAARVARQDVRAERSRRCRGPRAAGSRPRS